MRTERDPKKIIRKLRAEGWELSRISGSHHVFHHPGRKGIIIVPVHGRRDLKPGTARAIAKAAGWIK
ncbi:MAG: type II toxin-antitoxin system HicA family toxin [Xanthobacteraceae bacterium]|jgi:predicted RNA binding protein YcfA (HicA-like mRNA interferase family)|nr:type II toxin-antitoxin system HicA family toxin [Xanthobacteraceae bacterium]